MLTGQDLTLATTFFESYQVRNLFVSTSQGQTGLLTLKRLAQDSFKRKKRRTAK